MLYFVMLSRVDTRSGVYGFLVESKEAELGPLVMYAASLVIKADGGKLKVLKDLYHSHNHLRQQRPVKEMRLNQWLHAGRPHVEIGWFFRND